MAATAWSFFNKAKKLIGDATIDLAEATGETYRLSLHTSAAFSTSASVRPHTIFSSVGGEIAAQGGYTAGGRVLTNVAWTLQGDPGSVMWDADDLVFTASAANLSNIKFAVIHYSVNAATSGYPICWSRLSTS